MRFSKGFLFKPFDQVLEVKIIEVSFVDLLVLRITFILSTRE